MDKKLYLIEFIVPDDSNPFATQPMQRTYQWMSEEERQRPVHFMCYELEVGEVIIKNIELAPDWMQKR